MVDSSGVCGGPGVCVPGPPLLLAVVSSPLPPMLPGSRGVGPLIRCQCSCGGWSLWLGAAPGVRVMMWSRLVRARGVRAGRIVDVLFRRGRTFLPFYWG